MAGIDPCHGLRQPVKAQQRHGDKHSKPDQLTGQLGMNAVHQGCRRWQRCIPVGSSQFDKDLPVGAFDAGSIGRTDFPQGNHQQLFVANQRADGLIIASPTGSTAYSLSAGGPMLHPSIPGWVLVPIAPHTLSNRPIVLSDATEVAVEVVSGRDVSANFDMQSLASLLHGDRILVKRSEHRVRFLHPQGWNYFATLRKKLRWNEGGS